MFSLHKENLMTFFTAKFPISIAEVMNFCWGSYPRARHVCSLCITRAEGQMGANMAWKLELNTTLMWLYCIVPGTDTLRETENKTKKQHNNKINKKAKQSKTKPGRKTPLAKAKAKAK